MRAVKQCGRPMLVSLSPGDYVSTDYLEVYAQAQMLRVTGDVWDTQKDIDKCFDAWKKWGEKKFSGLWFDMDMIPFGNLQLMSPATLNSKDITQTALYAGRGFTRKSQLSQAQMRTFITMRALAASPLMIGGDLPTMDEYSLKLLTNKEMIACNQSGRMGKLVYQNKELEVWKSDVDGCGGWIGIFNRSDTSHSYILSCDQLSLSNQTLLKNIWFANLHINWNNGNIVVEIPANDVLFIRYDLPSHA